MGFASANSGYIGVSQHPRAENVGVIGRSAPGVVTSGLVLYLDAANPASYSGSGTTWTDLSGYSNHGTLGAGVTWDSGIAGGVMTLTATSGSAGQNITTTGPNLATSSNTVMGATRITNTAISGRILNSLNNNWLLGHHNFLSNRHYAEGWITDLSGGAGTNIPGIGVDTNWRIWTGWADYTNDSRALYDGLTLHFGPNSYGSQGPNGFRLGSFNTTSEFSSCQIGFLLAYNRALTYDEIMQNYYFFKNRYVPLYAADWPT